LLLYTVTLFFGRGPSVFRPSNYSPFRLSSSQFGRPGRLL
jgi:hypothetical protein